MSKRISSLKVSISASRFGPDYTQLVAQVKTTDGQVYTVTEEARNDHFTSVFDYIWYRVGRLLRENIKGKQ